MHDTIKNQLEQDGYVVLEDFLRPAECDELLAAGLELTKNVPESEKATFSSTEQSDGKLNYQHFFQSNDKICYFFEEGALGPNGELKVDSSVSLNKVGHALHLLHPIFRCYTYSDRVKTVCRELALKEPAVVQSMYIYKNPFIGSESAPHQDATYIHSEPIPPIGFWIALEDATVTNGCLWIARGSHKSGVHRKWYRNPDKDSKDFMIYDKPAAVYPQSSFTPVPVTRGTCIILHGNVVHKSAPNKSEKSRHAYTFHLIEKHQNKYLDDNWLLEGENAPFLNVYTTPQII